MSGQCDGVGPISLSDDRRFDDFDRLRVVVLDDDVEHDGVADKFNDVIDECN